MKGHGEEGAGPPETKGGKPTSSCGHQKQNWFVVQVILIFKGKLLF